MTSVDSSFGEHKKIAVVLVVQLFRYMLLLERSGLGFNSKRRQFLRPNNLPFIFYCCVYAKRTTRDCAPMGCWSVSSQLMVMDASTTRLVYIYAGHWHIIGKAATPLPCSAGSYFAWLVAAFYPPNRYALAGHERVFSLHTWRSRK